MFQNVFIVVKNILRRVIWHSKLGSSIHSGIRHLVYILTLLPWPSTFSKSITLCDPTMHREKTWQSIYCYFLSKTWFSPSSLGTLDLRGQIVIQRLAKWTRWSPDFLFFILLARFVPFCTLVSFYGSSIHIPRNQWFYICYWHRIRIWEH